MNNNTRAQASADPKPPAQPDPRAVEFYLDVMVQADDMQLVRWIFDQHLFHGWKVPRRVLQAANRIHSRHLATLERAG